jgi:hypothetical protein
MKANLLNYNFETIKTPNSCIFSEDRKYRYYLERNLFPITDEQKTINFIMLNPSTADETKNDPTVERCCVRTKLLGFSKVVITNIFAFRSTDPKQLKLVTDPIGIKNDEHIYTAAFNSDVVICAWGKDGILFDRAEQVKNLLKPFELKALRISEITGQPFHPLYLPYDLPLLDFS